MSIIASQIMYIVFFIIFTYYIYNKLDRPPIIASEDESDFSIPLTIIIAIAICIALWIGGMFFTQWYADKQFTDISNDINGSNNINKYALFGDSFGSVNALISAFAFAGVIVAIVIQRNELKLQRKDLELQRKEFKIQNETLQFQRFENTFFNMLSLQQEIVNNLYYKLTIPKKVLEDAPDPTFGKIEKEVLIDRIIQGRELFQFSFEEVIHHIKLGNGHNKKTPGMRNYLYFKGMSNYNSSYTPSYFDHYFRYGYTIMGYHLLVKSNLRN